MISEKFIALMEKYFSNELSVEETKEFYQLLKFSKELKSEFEEQKRIKEVL